MTKVVPKGQEVIRKQTMCSMDVEMDMDIEMTPVELLSPIPFSNTSRKSKDTKHKEAECAKVKSEMTVHGEAPFLKYSWICSFLRLST